MSTSSGESNQHCPQVKIIVDARVRINREKLDLETVKALREMFTHKNPKFLQAKRMGFSTWKTPPNLNSFSLEDPFLLFPRGALNRITELLESRGYEIEAVVDRSLKLERMNLELAYKLYSYQQEAVDAVVRSGNCVMRGPCGSGKALSNTERVVLLDRTCPINEVKIGDMAAGTDGKFHRVDGVFPQGKRRLYRVTFTGGSFTDCDEEHIWTLVKRRNSSKKEGWRSVDMTTIELEESRLRNKGGRIYYLPTVQPLERSKIDLPLDPYLLGILIGDGCMANASVSINTPDPDVLQIANVPGFYRFKKLKHQKEGSKSKTYLLSRSSRNNKKGFSVQKILSELGLFPCKSVDKFLPAIYKRAHVEDRICLLRGLMDTDGSAIISGTSEYSTASPRLAEDVQELVWSLGGTCSLARRYTKCNGKRFISWRLNVKLPNGISLFELRRKKKVARANRQRDVYRAVDSVKFIGYGEATCISVTSPDRLFLTGDYIPTHNTICLLGIIAALKQPTLVIVHTEALKKQWASVVSDWLGFIPGSLGGKDKPNVRPITIGMQQTIWRWAKKDPPWAKKFGCIIGDEVHHWASRTFQDTATMFPAAYRVGASADEKRKDGLEHMIYDTFGPCVYEIKRQELIDMNRLLPVDMLLVRTGYENEGYLSDMEEGIPPDWNKMLNELTTDEDRNEVIKQTSLRLLAEPKNRLLMLSERVQTCHEWKEVFDSHGHPCRVMVGGNKNETEQAISDLRTGKIRIAVGTKIADEGLDIPQLTHVLVTCPVHTHPKRLEQMVGRAARVWEGKMQATAIYFWDSGMFPMPSTYSDDPFKKRARKSAFFRNLRKACSTLQEWDIDTDEIFDVK